MPGRRETILVAAIAAAVGWAAVEARHLELRPATGFLAERTPSSPPREVEASFSDLREAERSGRREEALLGLRQRAERGPHPGYASFLLGELAFEEGAYAAAVRHYRRALEREPGVGDRHAAFAAARTISARLEFVRTGPWASAAPRELDDLYYLQRRLAGGCE